MTELTIESLMFGIIIVGSLILIFGIFQLALTWFMLREQGDRDGDRNDWWEKPPFRYYPRRKKDKDKGD